MNDRLLPGPSLGLSLLGVLLRFRQHQVAVSGDICSMFHQVRLLPEDRSLLRFIWRDLSCEDPPDVYEWQVLPFGTMSSPCCTIFALQQHARNHQDDFPDTLQSVQQSFYVENCLESFPTIPAASERVNQLRTLLAEGGFNLRQWASNQPTVIAHLPPDARSSATEQWLNQNRIDPLEPTLGLRWNCADTLGYQYRPIEHASLTMRTAYQALASQYDPLGFIVLFTTHAKVLIQQLWSKQRGWDDPDLPTVLRHAWETWENKLQHLIRVSVPRCYSPVPVVGTNSEYDLHVFCDASERAYGTVAYLTVLRGDGIHTSFVMARSRVAPKRQQSMPRLELCAALAGAQLAKLVETEMTLTIRQTTLWSDSTTVLEWLQSDSCKFKVFVGIRVSEIQELTDRQAWRYVDTQNNPADDLTRVGLLNSHAPSGREAAKTAEPNRGRDPSHCARPKAPSNALIKDRDERLLHPGTERVYAEIRRQYWILRGRQAIRHHQLKCPSCQRWRAQPKVPQMADLPPQRLRLLCPPFYSTGVDCFGPYLVKIVRRTSRIFKCLTTRAVHLELLNSMDVDAFLLALRRFIAR
ncbi:hypothetical protein SKAU_G00190150 [Synaphobranchus kaupii]|uniref:Integrase zinc-binding domain-containing protein n=1 Tax=Synaphobranchus kaupii TaxID=118154 RepID=A0A9Q1FDF2_SYNKA|nr:hypothetical protein SKAU_G00190150 [Synaphobranchus kaupii]